MSACNELRGYEDVVVKVSSCPLNYSSAAVVLDDKASTFFPLMMGLGDTYYDLISEVLGELALFNFSHINGESSVGVWTEDMRRFDFAVVDEVKVEQGHQIAGVGNFMVSTFLAEAEARGASYAYTAPKQSPEWPLVNRSRVWNVAAHAENVATKAVLFHFTDQWNSDEWEKLVDSRGR